MQSYLVFIIFIVIIYNYKWYLCKDDISFWNIDFFFFADAIEQKKMATVQVYSTSMTT